MPDLLTKLENDPGWHKGRHGCWFRQISPNVRLDYWEASDLFAVMHFNKRGDWVTAKHGRHRGDINRAMLHAERLAKREEARDA